MNAQVANRGIASRNAVRALFIYGAARVFPALLSFAFTLACVQFLRPETYGVYALANLPSGIASAFAGAIAAQPLMRYATEMSKAALRKALFLIPAGAIVALLPVLVLYLLRYVSDVSVIAYTVALSLAATLINARRGFFIAMSRAMSVFWIDAARGAAALLALGGCLLWGVPNAASVMLALALGSVAALLLVPARIPEVPAQDSLREIDKSYLVYGVWVASWLALNGFLPVLERLVIEMRGDIADVGRYSAIADPINSIISSVGSILSAALMPKYVECWNRKEFSALRRLNWIAIGATIASGVLCILIGSLIVHFRLGQLARYLSEDALLAVTLLAGIVVWLAGVFVHKRLELLPSVASMFLCLLGAVLVFFIVAMLGRSLGALGVAVAKLVSGGCYIFFVLIAGRIGKWGVI